MAKYVLHGVVRKVDEKNENLIKKLKAIGFKDAAAAEKEAAEKAKADAAAKKSAEKKAAAEKEAGK